MAKKRPTAFNYDVSLSFAGEDRKYVEQVARCLVELGIRVFYDKYEEVDLWGKDLYEHLSNLYRNDAKYCVMFASKHYAKKLWTNHERRSAQERAFRENREYILPARFDNTPIPGLLETVGYISLKGKTPSQFAIQIADKVVELPRRNYYPPNPDRLADAIKHVMRLRSKTSIGQYRSSAYRLYVMLSRLTEAERDLIFSIMWEGCIAELPDNIHVDYGMLKRCCRFTPARIKKIALDIRPLGFDITFRLKHHGEEREETNPVVVFQWNDLNDDEPPLPTLLASIMMRTATDGLCNVCGLKAMQRMDFSNLSSKTMKEDRHLIERGIKKRRD